MTDDEPTPIMFHDLNFDHLIQMVQLYRRLSRLAPEESKKLAELDAVFYQFLRVMMAGNRLIAGKVRGGSCDGAARLSRQALARAASRHPAARAR